MTNECYTVAINKISANPEIHVSSTELGNCVNPSGILIARILKSQKSLYINIQAIFRHCIHSLEDNFHKRMQGGSCTKSCQKYFPMYRNAKHARTVCLWNIALASAMTRNFLFKVQFPPQTCKQCIEYALLSVLNFIYGYLILTFVLPNFSSRTIYHIHIAHACTWWNIATLIFPLIVKVNSEARSECLQIL